MLRGINYDTGFGGLVGDRSRVAFDPAVVRRELEVIATDLHRDAVRVSGDDPDRLVVAANAAIDAGLRVWFSPFPMDLTPPELGPYFAECTRRAEEIRARDPETVLVLGCEMSLFCTGFVPGAYLFERFRTASDPSAWANFATYAAGDWEEIDWADFDFAAADLYRSSSNAAGFRSHVRRHLGHGKPLVVTEFGCSTHRGAADAGGTGWTIVDFTARPRVTGW